jgi:L-ascorbate metabolism protein UlaG (beta-lactamase superfamily)
MVVLYVFLGLILAIPLSIGLIGWAISAPRYKGAVSDHFDGQNFFNPTGHRAKDFADVVRWQRDTKREKGRWQTVPNPKMGEKPTPSVSEGQLRVTYIGHSTVLLQFDGLNVLTDPVWYERCSPVQWAGPKRVRPAGIHLADLPTIHIVLQSHNHWDHLDIRTLKKIYARDKPRIYTSLGISAFLNQHGMPDSIEMDWWEERAFSPPNAQNAVGQDSYREEVKITCLPAQHFSGRGTRDRFGTLWSSFMLSSPRLGNVFFAGDSGYGLFFKRIGEQFGTIRLALIPIGAFKPVWFMSPIHCSPAEAVQIHLDLRAERSLAIHHSTFPLADDGQTEPLDLLREARILRGVSAEQFFVLSEGAFEDI